MAGVIDDFQDALNEIIRAAHLPVSVVVIKIGGMQEENDSASLMNLSSEAFTNCDRQFVRVMDYDESYKKRTESLVEALDDSKLKQDAKSFMRSMFEHELIVDLPKQIEKFFEQQQFEMADEVGIDEQDSLVQRDSTEADTIQMMSVSSTGDNQEHDMSFESEAKHGSDVLEIPPEYQADDETQPVTVQANGAVELSLSAEEPIVDKEEKAQNDAVESSIEKGSQVEELKQAEVKEEVDLDLQARLAVQRIAYEQAPVRFDISSVPSDYTSVVSMFLEQEKLRMM